MVVRRLRHILSLQTVIASAVPFLVVTALGLFWLIPRFDSGIKAQQLQLANAIASQVETHLDASLVAVKGVATLHLDISLDTHNLQHILDAQTRSSEALAAMYAVNTRGRLIAVGLPSQNPATRQDLVDFDISQNPLFKEVKTAHQPRWSDTFLSIIGRGLTVALAIPTDKMVIIGEVQLDQLTQYLKRIVNTKEELIFVIDRHGQVIADTTGTYTAQQLNVKNIPLVAEGMKTPGPDSGTFLFNNRTMLGSFVHVTTIDWYVLVAQPKETAYQPVLTTMGIAAVALIAALICGSTLMLLMSRHLAASCENLAAHARLTAANQETCDWPRSSITEFNNLAEDLESMAETIKGREEELQEKNEELTIAEEELRHLNDDLEGRVMERTAQLESANQEISSLNEDLTGRSNDLERTNRELAEVNHQLEAFSFSISHDLQAPLRHINGFSRILMEDHARDLSKDAQSLLERISAGCERMDQLINGLLRFSRFSRQPITKMTVETNSLVQQVVDELDLQQRPQAVELVLHELPSCQADRQLLRQVFQNLIGNALKYSANVTQPHIEIGSCLQEGQTIFFVRDNGVGFDMKYADKLFGVFQRLHKEEEFAGTGVGLSIVHNIITRHGGKVWAEAELNKGATFFFTL